MGEAIKTYKEYYKKFNKKFFNGSLPDVDIKIEKMKGKNAVGEFNYTASLKYSDGKKEKFFDIKKAIFHNKADQHTKDEWDDIIADAYIAMPKEAFKKGKYYWASILLHEMTHVWQRLVSDSMEEKDHGHDFRKKVDEINKKSKNEWRVGYEEISPKLVSDEPIDERPEGDENMNESIMDNSRMTLDENFITEFFKSIKPDKKPEIEHKWFSITSIIGNVVNNSDLFDTIKSSNNKIEDVRFDTDVGINEKEGSSFWTLSTLDFDTKHNSFSLDFSFGVKTEYDGENLTRKVTLDIEDIFNYTFRYSTPSKNHDAWICFDERGYDNFELFQKDIDKFKGCVNKLLEKAKPSIIEYFKNFSDNTEDLDTEEYEESLKAETWVKNVVLKEGLFGNKDNRGYQIAVSIDDGHTWKSVDSFGKISDEARIYQDKSYAKEICDSLNKKAKAKGYSRRYKVVDSNEQFED